MTPTIWHKPMDKRREQIVADAIHDNYWPYIEFDPTPKYYPTDYHLTLMDGEYGGYIGDLEIKWFRHDSSRPGMFNYNKLMLILAMPIWRDHDHAYHRLALRYDDGILLAPARELGGREPQWYVRRDTAERDLVIHIPLDELKERYWLPLRTEDNRE